jgi:hypothetical protein
MLAEIASIDSAVAATAWANTMLRPKNSLTAEDARVVETAFEMKFAGLAAEIGGDETSFEPMPHDVPESNAVVPDVAIAVAPSVSAENSRPRNLPITKTVRHRNKEHLRFVRLQPCLVCAKQPADPHHLSFAQPRALGRKVSDEFTVPLCRAHHREAHRAMKEIAWWRSVGIAPLAVAETLWRTSQSGHALDEQVTEPLEKRPAKRGGRATNGHGDAPTPTDAADKLADIVPTNGT